MPLPLFNIIIKDLEDKLADNGLYYYDCNKKVNDIALDVKELKNNKLKISRDYYTSELENNECVVHIKPFENDDTVAGITFFRAYRTCFSSKQNSISFSPTTH